MGQPSRLDELRRRVRQDPASIAFAALAEEYRRQGLLGDAIELCRAGLARHPTYILGRVTLARALFDSGDTDAAILEFEHVLRIAPDNLAALRGLAEAHAERGEIAAALERLRAAAAFAPQDAALRARMGELEAALGPAGRPGETADSGPSRAWEGTAPREGGQRTAALPEAAGPATTPQEVGESFWPPPAPLSPVSDPGVRDAAADHPDRQRPGDVRDPSGASPQQGSSGALERDGGVEAGGTGRQEHASFSAAGETAPEPQAAPLAVSEPGHAVAADPWTGEDAAPDDPAGGGPHARVAAGETMTSHGFEQPRGWHETLPGNPHGAGRVEDEASPAAARSGPHRDSVVSMMAGAHLGDPGSESVLEAAVPGEENVGCASAAAAAPSAGVRTEPVELRAHPAASDEGAWHPSGGAGLAPAVAWAEPGEDADPWPPAVEGCGGAVEALDAPRPGEAGTISGDAGGGRRLLLLQWPARAGTGDGDERGAVADAGESASSTATPAEPAAPLSSVESAAANVPDAAGWDPEGARTAEAGWWSGSAAGAMAPANPHPAPFAGLSAWSGEGGAAGSDAPVPAAGAAGLSAWSGESVAGSGSLEETAATDAGADAWSLTEGYGAGYDPGRLEGAIVSGASGPATVPENGPPERAFETASPMASAPGVAARSPSVWELSAPEQPGDSGSAFELADPRDLARAAAARELGDPDASIPQGPEAIGAPLPSGIPPTIPNPPDDGPQPATAGSGNGQPPVAPRHGDGVPSDRRTAALRTLERWLEALERARSARSCPP